MPDIPAKKKKSCIIFAIFNVFFFFFQITAFKALTERSKVTFSPNAP